PARASARRTTPRTSRVRPGGSGQARRESSRPSYPHEGEVLGARGGSRVPRSATDEQEGAVSGTLREGGTAMANAIVSVPPPRNESVLSYAPGTAERRALREELTRLASETIDITPRIGGARVETGKVARVVMPHRHTHTLATWHQAGAVEVERAIDAALTAHPSWSRMAWEDRAAIFLRAADLLAGPWRMRLNAATM